MDLFPEGVAQFALGNKQIGSDIPHGQLYRHIFPNIIQIVQTSYARKFFSYYSFK